MKNLKSIYFIFPLLIFSSCKDDISDGNYRNESYVFYQEEGKVGEWQLIDPLLKITPPKSNSTYFFPNGNKYAELTVIDSFPNRIIKFYDKETDKLTRTTFYKLDTLQKEIYVEGYYRQYHSSLGALQSEGIIKDGMTQGEWKYYADDGVTIEQISQNKDDAVDGFQKLFYADGKVKEINIQKKGLLHGPIKEYYENGVLKKSQKYWNDRIIDTNRVYNEDGTIKMIQIHHLDTITFKKNFMQFNYNANGKLEATAFFENNKSNLKIYYENGNLKEVSTKVNNKHHGLVTIFHENGFKMMEGTASNGILVGDFKFYNQSGKLIKTVYYELGNPIKTITH